MTKEPSINRRIIFAFRKPILFGVAVFVLWSQFSFTMKRYDSIYQVKDKRYQIEIKDYWVKQYQMGMKLRIYRQAYYERLVGLERNEEYK